MAEHTLDLAAYLLRPFTDPASRTYIGSLVLALFIALGVHGYQTGFTRKSVPTAFKTAFGHLRHPSSQLDIQLLVGRQLLRAVGILPATLASIWLASSVVMSLDKYIGIPPTPEIDSLWLTAAYSVTLFLFWDVSRYIVHRLMHEVPILWQFHQVHHSAEVLTPLTFHRLHPLESLLYQIRGMVVTTTVVVLFFYFFRQGLTEWQILGVHGIGFLFNGITGNLRHSHIWWRFPASVEYWLISPAQHQQHHSAVHSGYRFNYGTWLSIWDRLGGSLHHSTELPPQEYGIPRGDRNHSNTLLSAWWGPIRAVLPRRLTIPLCFAALCLGQAEAHAQETTETPPPIEAEAQGDDTLGTAIDQPALEITVVATQATSEVAGSAHSMDEATLERFEYDDIHRVVATIPGVYVRGEDGFGLRPNIGIRGGASERSAKITLLEDGIPFAPAPYAAPSAYYFPQTTRMVGLEVFKGPAATRHGPQTIGGAINLKTREIPNNGLMGSLDLAAGSYPSAKFHGYVGAGNDRGGWLIEGVQLWSNGFKTLDSGRTTGFDRTELMAKGRINIDTDGPLSHQIQLKLGFAREDSNETYLGLHPDDYSQTPLGRYAATDLDHMRWYRTQAELYWNVRFSRRINMRTTAYHHYLTRAWSKFSSFVDGPNPHTLLQSPDEGVGAVYLDILRGEQDSSSNGEHLIIGTNDRQFHSGGIQNVVQMAFGQGDPIFAKGEAGVRLHYDWVQRTTDDDIYAMTAGILAHSNSDALLSADKISSALALALHNHWDIRINRFHLQPGLRAEHVVSTYQDLDDETNSPQSRWYVMPGFGILANATSFLDVFAGAHRGFSPVAPGQPEDIQPEIAWNYELGARVNTDHIKADLSGFFSDYQNLIGQCSIVGGCTGDTVDQQFNAGKVFIAGVEASYSHDIPLSETFSLPIGLSYTYSWTHFRESFVSSFPQFGDVNQGDLLPYLPPHQGTAHIGLQHERFSIHVGGEFRSGMLDVAGPWPPTETDIPPLVLLDVAVQARVHGPLWMYLTGTNLMNNHAMVSWRPAGMRPTAPLQVMLGIKVRPGLGTQ